MEKEIGLGADDAEAGSVAQLDVREHSPSTADRAESKTPFDYGSLSSNVAGDLQAVANQIRNRTATAVIETGRDLNRVKDQLNHGQFTAWVEGECGIPARTARRLMRSAIWAEGKTAAAAVLPPMIIDALAAPDVPAEIEAQVIAEYAAGRRAPVKDVVRMITAARSAAGLPETAETEIEASDPAAQTGVDTSAPIGDDPTKIGDKKPNEAANGGKKARAATVKSVRSKTPAVAKKETRPNKTAGARRDEFVNTLDRRVKEKPVEALHEIASILSGQMANLATVSDFHRQEFAKKVLAALGYKIKVEWLGQVFGSA